VILLAIESATELVGAAVVDDDGPRAAVWATGRRRHAEALAPAVGHVLEQAGVGLGDLAAVAVDIGPGLFTGLRVGVATAKGLAQGLGVGVVGVTSLEVLAAAAYEGGWPGPVASVVDARRGEVFVGWFAPGTGGPPHQSAPPTRRTPEELAAELAAAGEVLVVGDGARRYAELLEPLAGVTVGGPSLAAPPPAILGVLAAHRLASGEAATTAAEVRPIYLREPDVRINWVERTGRAAPP
jgi:tRNA threonylcarbamoyladenosine biosynthesis protein TsaB